ncbi:cytochrome b5, partial [Saccharata proteae CBS 121410]
ITALDILRVLSGVLLLSCTLSYFVTAGDSILWGQRPWFSRAGVVRAWIRGPTLLTDAELTAYSGADPALPILLALNGSIYDVTAGRHFYGPGGGYHFFAGRDAARAFVTGCFDTDLTADLRGVEDMFVAVEEGDDDGGGGETSAERKNRRAKELREARRKVRDAVEGWQKVFRGETGKEYFEVGRVVREEGWLEREPRRELCERARKARPKRK